MAGRRSPTTPSSGRSHRRPPGSPRATGPRPGVRAADAGTTMDDVRFTHVGGPTVLIEVGGWRLLTDPTFDPPGQRYGFGWGSWSRKLVGPAVPAEQLAPIDAVLLSHDHHEDNLD